MKLPPLIKSALLVLIAIARCKSSKSTTERGEITLSVENVSTFSTLSRSTGGIREWNNNTSNAVSIVEANRIRGLYTASNSILQLDVISTRTNAVVYTNLRNGAIINLKSYGLTLPSQLNFNTITGILTGSVKYGFNGNASFRIESTLPYSMCGDISDTFLNCTSLLLGTHSITITPYAGVNATGSIGAPLTINFQIISGETPIAAPVPAPLSVPVSSTTNNTIVRVEVYNAIRNIIVNTNMLNGTILNLNSFGLSSPTNLNFNTVTSAATMSVRYAFDANPNFRIESIKPFSLCGDVSSVFYNCSMMTLGVHKITVTPFSLIDAKGIAGTPKTIHFEIANTPIPAPVKPPVPVPVPVKPPLPLPVPVKSPLPVTVPVKVPVPVPVPIKAPLPVPLPIPVPVPVKAPIPVPAPILEPVPVPVKASSPVTVPSKAPVLVPVPVPIKSPLPMPLPIPVPVKSPVPVPAPMIAPVPVPVKAPLPVNLPIKAPVPVPVPIKAPLPVPLPIPVPVTAPIPVPTTTMLPPAPVTVKAPLPVTIPTNIPVSLPSAAVPSPTTISKLSTIRINAGSDTSYISPTGATWDPDTTFIRNGKKYGSCPRDILNTDFDPLYCTERFFPGPAGMVSTINIKVIPGGMYSVNLMFSETYWALPNSRLFTVLVQNKTIQTAIDLISLAGANTAYVISTETYVPTGIIRIDFMNIIDSAKISAIEIKPIDAPHLAHSVVSGSITGTVVDSSGKAKVLLIGETSHTHGSNLTLVDAQWKEGDTVLGKTLNMNYSFAAGNHTVSLTIKDNGNHTDTDTTTVLIKPLGFPAITQLLPNNGSMIGNYDVIIKGSGFTHASMQTTIFFGPVQLTGASIQIIDTTTIKVRCPMSDFGQPVMVKVATPLGESETSEFNYIGSAPIKFLSGLILDFAAPTVGRFGPDQKLYVGTRWGQILKITMNADFTKSINVLAVQVNKEQESILGLAFDPTDTKEYPDVYFTSSKLLHKGELSSSGLTINGKIRMASGSVLEVVTDVVWNLPVSDLDHALNGMEFGDTGELYFTTGSNTNGGIPGDLSQSGLLEENFLSAGVNVAYLNHPDFSGDIRWSSPDDGNMIAKGIDVFAMGLRNPYNILLHSNGKMYATDNGPNVGYGRMKTGCGDDISHSIDDQQRPDELLLIEKGKYYGHPNPKRAQYFKDPRQCTWIGPEIKSTVNYTGPLLTHQSSVNGMMEFHGNHFAGQLRHNLLFIRYSASNNIFRVILAEDGRTVVPSSTTAIPLSIGFKGLDLTQAPNGNLIEIRYSLNTLNYHRPVEQATTEMVAKTSFPRRGPNAGGNVLSVYGVNFMKNGPSPTVQVGSQNCPVVFSSSDRIDCRLPGGSGTVDVIVTNGWASSTFSRGYRYVSGTLALGFKLPIYT